MEYYSSIKRNKIGSFAEMWLDLESVMQSEVSQKIGTDEPPMSLKYYLYPHPIHLPRYLIGRMPFIPHKQVYLRVETVMFISYSQNLTIAEI